MTKITILLTMLLASNALYASEKESEVTKPADTTETFPSAGKENSKPVPIKAPMLSKEEATEINVIVEKKRTIEEYRHRGELIMVKVIPQNSKAYFIDPLENRQQGSAKELMDAGVKPVHWVVKEF